MPSQIDEIREKLDIVQVLSEYLQLKKTGANFRANCPFHSEKKPSFFVSPSKQIFKCFGCGASGDVFKFVMQIEGLEFKDALPILARKAGVELRREPIKERTERQKIYDICELATKFFEKQIESNKGKRVKEYLKKRGMDDKTIKEWRIGYSPNTWQGLSDFLVGKGFKREQVIKAGLAIDPEKENKTPYDRFRGRIMFPIFDLQSNPVGFGGRIFEKEEETDPAKYINTPNTIVYDKSRILYGLNKAKVDIRKKEKAILVEGYTDVILSNKAGVTNIVSSSGTSLTPYQLKILSRYTKNLTFGFDMDIAGESATKRGIDIAQLLEFDIKIVPLPKEKDPADVIKENPEEWKKLTEKAKPIIEFYFEKAFSQFDKNTLEGKKQISQLLLPFFARIQNKIEESECISRLAKELKLKEEALWEELRKIRKEHKETSNFQEYTLSEEVLPEKEEKNLRTRQRKIEERFLMLILKGFKCEKEKFPCKFSFDEGQKIFNCILEEKKVPKELKSFLNELELQFEVEKEEKGEIDLEKEAKFCINSLKTIKKEREIRKITEKLKDAEEKKDKKKVIKLLNQIKEIQSI
ncbi:MAG: DNA primase [Candidatus Pacebacteria bacterium]|nr:DNA primase [Candidatus Paceibacterota bacterium]